MFCVLDTGSSVPCTGLYESIILLLQQTALRNHWKRPKRCLCRCFSCCSFLGAWVCFYRYNKNNKNRLISWKLCFSCALNWLWKNFGKTLKHQFVFCCPSAKEQIVFELGSEAFSVVATTLSLTFVSFTGALSKFRILFSFVLFAVTFFHTNVCYY